MKAAAQGTTTSGPTTTPSGPRPVPDPVSWLPPWVWETATSDPGRVLAAVVVVAAGIYLSKFVVRLAGRPIARRFTRESVAQTVLRLLRLSVVVGAIVVALGVLKIPIGSLVLSVTVFSAVLGIVLAPIVGSIISGLFVLADQPYEIGDMIELPDGTQGFVEEMTIRYTKILTLDNTFLVIPNGTIRDQKVVNYSAEDERIRLALPVIFTYESDIARARTLLERAAGDVDEVIDGGPDIRIGSARYPAKPTAYIDEYAADGVKITLRYWASKPYKLLRVRSRVQTELGSLIEDAANVEVAYPHTHLVFDETSGTAQVAVGSLDGHDEEVAGDSDLRAPEASDGEQ
jgi:small-conductance mechanosensitive channel